MNILVPPTIGMDDGRVQVHGLKIPAPVPVGDSNITWPHIFRGNDVQARPSSTTAGRSFLRSWTTKSDRSGRQRYAVWTSMISPTAGMLEMPQQRTVRMPLQVFICNGVITCL